jgi:PleD family two-component response regulator
MPRKKNLHLKLIDPAKLPVLVIHHNNPNVTARALALLIAQQTNIFRHQGEPARLDLDKDDEPKLVMLDWMDIVELGYELANPVKHTKDGSRGARIPHDVGKARPQEAAEYGNNAAPARRLLHHAAVAG